MTRVLMVCLGNICRSPLAEGILRSKITSEEIFVDSAGTGNYHVGEQPDSRSIEVGLKYNIDIRSQRARQFVMSDFDDFDHILVMDRSNYSNVINLARSEDDARKVRPILDFLNNSDISEVPDPYYGGEQGFEQVFQLLNDACELIIKELS